MGFFKIAHSFGGFCVAVVLMVGRLCGSDEQNRDQCVSAAQIPTVKSLKITKKCILTPHLQHHLWLFSSCSAHKQLSPSRIPAWTGTLLFTRQLQVFWHSSTTLIPPGGAPWAFWNPQKILKTAPSTAKNQQRSPRSWIFKRTPPKVPFCQWWRFSQLLKSS